MLSDQLILEKAIPGPGKAPAKLYDADGLLLLVSPSGSRLWRLKYRRNGKEGSLPLGSYPLVPIVEARAKAAAAKRELARGLDPAVPRRDARTKAYIASTNSFAKVSLEFLALDDTKAVRTADKHAWLHGLLSPLHTRLVSDIKAPDVIKVLRAIEATGKREAARRCSQYASRVFRYAIQEGYLSDKPNPAADLRGALKPVKVESHPGITDPILFGQLMRDIDEDEYAFVTVRHSLQLMARVFLRSWELRGALWPEINFEKAEWRVPKERMKMKREHLVPLSKQSVLILRKQHEISGTGELVFPGARSGRPISDAALGVAIKRLLYLWTVHAEHVPHGFRTSASTMLNENGFDPAIVELQLSHAKRDKIAGIYDKSQRVAERRTMMQWWSDHIDEIKLG